MWLELRKPTNKGVKPQNTNSAAVFKMKTNLLVHVTASVLIVILLGHSRCTDAAYPEFEPESLERRSAEMAYTDDLAKQWLRTVIAKRGREISETFNSEEKRGSSKSIDMAEDMIRLILWCRKMGLKCSE